MDPGLRMGHAREAAADWDGGMAVAACGKVPPAARDRDGMIRGRQEAVQWRSGKGGCGGGDAGLYLGCATS